MRNDGIGRHEGLKIPWALSVGIFLLTLWIVFKGTYKYRMEEYQSHILPNGLTVIHQQRDSKVSYCGVAVKVGSRDESAEQYGVAHFVEHTIFKGTLRRKSWHILNCMESVGGELNAYTTKEETNVYSAFPSEYYPKAVDLLADLVCNSQFPQTELDKERDVVLDEIASYRDSPSEAVYDDFEDMIFAGSGLGHNILGTSESLEQLNSRECMQFLSRHYRADNMVFFSYGNIVFDKLCRLVEKQFLFRENADGVVGTGCDHAGIDVVPFSKTVKLGNHQSHTIFGAKTFSMYDERRFALSVLNFMLAGPGMNSLLNVALREKRGYVYTVESNATLYSDTGLLAIYFGCDANHVSPCLRLIRHTLEDIANGKLTQHKLDAVKRQIVGQLLLSTENHENMALGLGKAMLNHRRVMSLQDTCEQLSTVTREQIATLSEQVLKNASVLTLE